MQYQWPKVYFVVVYFGLFPGYIQLWLDACARNGKFNWLLLTDCDVTELVIPENVLVKKMDIVLLQKFFMDKLSCEIALAHSYKLCDYRPIYWLLLDHYAIEYDFWGYCDVDVVFGRLDRFITQDMFDQYDKIGSYGHLTLFRNSWICKMSFALKGGKLSWNKVFCCHDNLGFDERHGINSIWRYNKLSYINNTHMVADIDPQYCSFRLTDVFKNHRLQMFYLLDGKILQGFFDFNGKWRTREYAYIHFQKRKMPFIPALAQTDGLLFTTAGFVKLDHLPVSKQALQKLIPSDAHFSLSQRFKIMRSCLRYYKNMLIDRLV